LFDLNNSFYIFEQNEYNLSALNAGDTRYVSQFVRHINEPDRFRGLYSVFRLCLALLHNTRHHSRLEKVQNDALFFSSFEINSQQRGMVSLRCNEYIVHIVMYLI